MSSKRAGGEEFDTRDPALWHEWDDSGGAVARRTNDAIRVALEVALKKDYDRVDRRFLTSAVDHATDVGTERSIGKYVRRMTEKGPFVRAKLATWELDHGAIEAVREAADDD